VGAIGNAEPRRVLRVQLDSQRGTARIENRRRKKSRPSVVKPMDRNEQKAGARKARRGRRPGRLRHCSGLYPVGEFDTQALEIRVGGAAEIQVVAANDRPLLADFGQRPIASPANAGRIALISSMQAAAETEQPPPRRAQARRRSTNRARLPERGTAG
jgi:hypothetical protein